jgi:predicted metalloprotease with PDZ domain
MRLSLRPPILALVALLAACARGEAPPGRIVESVNPINYYVRVTSPGSDRLQITLAADHLRRDSVDFVLPAWIPGQYATRVPSVAENFAARDGGGSPIPVRRLAVNVWRLYTETTDYVTVDYHIRPGTPVEPLASRIQLDLHGGFAMGGAIFGFLDGIVGRPVTVTFDLPPGWRATSPLRPAGPNRFAATSYREIPGSPFVIGDRWAEYKLFVQGKPHQIVVQGAPPDFPPDTLLRLVNETIDHATLFLGRPPYERYIFAIHFVSPEESGMGASGQAAGSALFLPPLAGNRMREAGLGSLLLHQYLHAWYPGQFGPVSLMRPEYRFPPRVPDAWLIEGAAEYYARLLPVRHGTMDRQEFYDALADVLWYWRELGGGNRIDLLDLATAGRSGDARESSRLVAGGTLAVFLLDLMIREETGGLRGVDQILHFLQRRSGTTGYLEDQVWTEAAAVLGLSPAALDLLATQGSIPIEANLARAGLRQVQRDLRRRSLGAVLAPDAAGRFVVNAVERGGTAASAGMREGDRLVKINDTPVAPDEVIATRFALMTYIEEAETGSAVTFEVVRRGQPMELRGTVRALPGTRIAIVEASDASPTALQVRNSLFRSSSYATD